MKIKHFLLPTVLYGIKKIPFNSQKVQILNLRFQFRILLKTGSISDYSTCILYRRT